ncbi:uncharacterized protein LOC113209147 isoform X1 [Frankliniella occidentalis]|uniref:Uncharacterized protein LOC113209147 isoform X1 n=1 Tax=Frankliniella occidentalis TaxID=133901 RepID=A0A9C6WYD6_FRAOC|nr:uncharacterized protein LOC113209147 isoform X1 [Frankliniella occidentalis]XP_052123246.1 uncharacterized protein LOC113209147 isoform X1 [Frankliniella occidentalis]XP_052123248.1 uncharacterized protein LOC113209147 isoform X1 [Frankliniella occidentalis]XP_052123249.1 uncharacterized protein LOC113209147 isoform X1 [Frankliniella occidentalis]XP_052123250.1 uncharacterized protein LOC113209147 isoform X1 [Frankliniella occidentalis]
MEQLSDDAVLQVLRFLDVPSLLTCRLVCRRLGDLVLHPDAWLHREVGAARRPCMCSVLRLAPCLRRLDTTSAKITANSCLPAALASTRCAVAELQLWVHNDVEAGVATALILRQAGLGRLRCLGVSLGVNIEERVSASMISMFLAAVASTRGWKEIDISMIRTVVPSFRTTASVALGSAVTTPSLKNFRCDRIPGAEPFVLFMLAGHADTLETVDLGPSPPNMFAASIAPLLAGMAHLRELSCCNLRGLEALTGCQSLRILRLGVSRHEYPPVDRAACAGAAKLLRHAEHLRKLTLGAVQANAGVVVDLICALAASGRSRLEWLTISTIVTGPHVQALIRALPGLPALQFLEARVDVKQDVDDLVLAITPITAPALQRVELELDFTKGKVCVHAWFHGDAFKTLMERNPLLHFILRGEMYCGDKFCQACAKGCHAAVLQESSLFSNYFLFCHDPEKKCSVDHSLKLGDGWGHWVHTD